MNINIEIGTNTNKGRKRQHCSQETLIFEHYFVQL